MKINIQLLPIKAHYFFFMASMGPILPQLSVYGKQLGISSLVMGTVTGVLPIMFLLAKPIFGFIADRYRKYRKQIFIALIITMGIMYAGLFFVPARDDNINFKNEDCRNAIEGAIDGAINGACNVTDDLLCRRLNCTLILTQNRSEKFEAAVISNKNICILSNNLSYDNTFSSCELSCESTELSFECTLSSTKFWFFVLFMSAGTIGFNVLNSISDAICFDVLGDGQQMDYGKQRVWGTIGFGCSAFISGYFVNWWSLGDVKSFTPALIIMLMFIFIDVLCCKKLKLPIMETPKNIMKDITELLKLAHIRIFIIFATLAGIIDSFFVYFFFWYLEELAEETGYIHNIKLLEGIIVAAETLGGEVLFFTVSGSILKIIGYGHTLSMCFAFYALRLGLISIIPNPWWAFPIELLLQGPTYALCYTTIVAYASAVSPPGTSATMQGLVAGMDDGFGYAIGSILCGITFRSLGGRATLNIFSAGALACAILHSVLYLTVLKNKIPSTQEDAVAVEYHLPQEAVKQTQNHDE